MEWRELESHVLFDGATAVAPEHILHATRSPDAPAGSGPLVLEQLSAFWPGP
jgi:hypothetical protein